MKPIHIMRWAPADYVNDPSVKLALAQRDLVASTFYPLFLFHAFIQGGKLPADRVALGAIVGMKPADVERAMKFWTAQGKLKEEGGSIYHERVVRDIADERAFREKQQEHAGKRWGGNGSGSAPAQATHSRPSTGRQSPPSPLPTPTPEPVPRAGSPEPFPARPGNPLIAGRRPEIEKEGYALIREINAYEPQRDATEILMEAAGWKDREGNVRTKVRLETMNDDHLIRTIHDLKTIRDDAKRKHGTPTAARN